MSSRTKKAAAPTAHVTPSSLLSDIKGASQKAQVGDTERAETLLKRTVRTVKIIVDNVQKTERKKEQIQPAEESKPEIELEGPSIRGKDFRPDNEEEEKPSEETEVIDHSQATLQEWQRLLALALHHLASVQKKQGKLKRALKSAEESHQVEQSAGQASPSTMLNLIVIYTAVGEFEWAVDMAETTVNIMATRPGMSPGMWGAVYHNKAVAMLHLLMRFGEGNPSAVYETLEKSREYALDGGDATMDLLMKVQETESVVLAQFGPQSTTSETPRRSGPRGHSYADQSPPQGSQSAPAHKTASKNGGKGGAPRQPHPPPQVAASTRSASKPSGKGGKSKSTGTIKKKPLTLPSINKTHVLDAMQAHRHTQRRFTNGEAIESTLPEKLRRKSMVSEEDKGYVLPPKKPKKPAAEHSSSRPQPAAAKEKEKERDADELDLQSAPASPRKKEEPAAENAVAEKSTSRASSAHSAHPSSRASSAAHSRVSSRASSRHSSRSPSPSPEKAPAADAEEKSTDRPPSQQEEEERPTDDAAAEAPKQDSPEPAVDETKKEEDDKPSFLDSEPSSPQKEEQQPEPEEEEQSTPAAVAAEPTPEDSANKDDETSASAKEENDDDKPSFLDSEPSSPQKEEHQPEQENPATAAENESKEEQEEVAPTPVAAEPTSPSVDAPEPSNSNTNDAAAQPSFLDDDDDSPEKAKGDADKEDEYEDDYDDDFEA